jgi:hypothetical protein
VTRASPAPTARSASSSRGRRSEHRHGGVADELLQQPAVPVDRLPNRLEIGVLDDRHVLGVESLRQRREADQVGEEDGDDAALDRAACHRASVLRLLGRF